MTIRYILSKDVKKLCKLPDLSDNGKYIKSAEHKQVFVNILETCDNKPTGPITVKLKCYYPDGHIEEGWTFRDIICPITFFNFSELLDGRFNQ